MDWLSWLFPPKCSGCGQQGAYICADCLNRLSPLKDLYCPVCRHPAVNGYTHPHCRRPDQIDGLISCYVYRGIIKRIIAKYKYKYVADLHHTLVELLLSELKHPLLFHSTWTLVPVPLHPARQRWRGFNQAELLAHSLSTQWQMPYSTHLLHRIRQTQSQMTLSAVARRHNLKHAFAVSPNLPPPASVLLIDDVATTRATLRECAVVLKAAGVKQVWGLTLAQTTPKVDISPTKSLP
jgi:ComF family protein